MKVKLGDIRPNPFRDLTHYVMDEEKIAALINSIESTSFWSETVLVRRHPDGVEQAFGHHRIEAARRHLGVDAEVEVTVRKLDDADMLRMMAEENLREWKHDLAVQIQTVQAVIDADRDGKINLPEAKDGGRPALTFTAGGKRVSAEGISSFLGGNWSQQRVSDIAKHLTYFGEDAAEELQDLSPTAAAEIVKSAEAQAQKAGLAGEEKKQAVRETTRDYAERVKRGEHRILDQARQDAGKKPKHDVGNAIVGDEDRRAAFVAGLTPKERNLLAREIRSARADDAPMYVPNEDTEPVFRLMALLREGQLGDWISGVEDKFEPVLALLDRIAKYREEHGDDVIDGEVHVGQLISDSLIELREKVRQAFDAAMGEDNFAKEILG